MASVADRWHVTRAGTRVRSARYGTGRRWQVRYRDASGASRNRSFDRKVDAERFATSIGADLLRGEYVDPRAGRVLFREYAVDWLGRRVVQESSREAMARRVRCHMEPTWGEKSLASITAAGIQAWVRSLSDELAPSQVRLIFVTFGAILASAVDDGLIARDPTRLPGVRAPSVPPRRFTPWTADRVRDVLVAHPTRYRTLIAATAAAGLRQGEAFGLRVQDVRADRSELRIAQQIKLTAGRPAPDLPKYGRSRSVPVPEWLIADLLAYADEWQPMAGERADGPGLGGLLFSTREQRPLNRNYFNSAVWRPALEAAGVPAGRENGMHALRHFCASTWLEHGVSIKAVSEYLGHADPGFTLRTYTHVMPTAHDKARSALSDLCLSESVVNGTSNERI